MHRIAGSLVTTPAGDLGVLQATVCTLVNCLNQKFSECQQCLGMSAPKSRPNHRVNEHTDALFHMQALHAQTMHLSITRDLKQHQGPSKVLSWSYQADAGLKHPPCPLTTAAGTGSCVLESTPSSAMNERYEYRLPPGLGMAVFGTGNGGGEAGDTSGRYTGCHASQKDSFVAPGVMPSGTGWSGLDLCPTTGTSLVIREGTGRIRQSFHTLSRFLDAIHPRTSLFNTVVHHVLNAQARGCH